MMHRHLFIFILLGLVWNASANAGSVHDPFLENWRTGAARNLDTMQFDDRGWPHDLFDTVSVAQGWSDPDFDQGTRDLLDALTGSTITSKQVLAGWTAGHKSRQELETAATSAWHNQDYAECARLCAQLVQDSDRNISTERRLIWTLRHLAAEEQSSGVTRPNVTFWDGMLELGPYDARSAWNLWRARHQATGAPLLPAQTADRAAAIWLAGLGVRGLESRDLDRASFPAELKAALGGACLPRSALGRHYGLYPNPPPGHTLAALWAAGKQRQTGRTAAGAERLGRLNSLPGSLRAEMLRRAADRRLSDGQWTMGHDNLAAAITAAGPDMSSYRARVLRTECLRAIAIDEHQGLSSYAQHARNLMESLPPESTLGDPLLDTTRDLVRRGQVPDVGAMPASLSSGIRERLDHQLWRIWAEWGQHLVSADQAATQQSQYMALLHNVEKASAEQRRTLAHDAVGQWLSSSFLLNDVVDWVLTNSIERSGGAETPAEPSPIPRLVSSSGATRIDRHALLGLSLLMGDARGQLACVVTLPRGSLTAHDNHLFLYPIPFRPEILTLLTEAKDPALALAVARNESLFDPAVRSRSGALGWMQIMPFHYPGGGVSSKTATWRIPHVSVAKGLSLLTENARRYDGDPYRTVAAYNAGPGAVSRWLRQLGGQPSRQTFLAWIGYPETRHYTEKVLIDRQIYGEILDEFSLKGATQQ